MLRPSRMLPTPARSAPSCPGPGVCPAGRAVGTVPPGRSDRSRARRIRSSPGRCTPADTRPWPCRCRCARTARARRETAACPAAGRTTLRDVVPWLALEDDLLDRVAVARDPADDLRLQRRARGKPPGWSTKSFRIRRWWEVQTSAGSRPPCAAAAVPSSPRPSLCRRPARRPGCPVDDQLFELGGTAAHRFVDLPHPMGVHHGRRRASSILSGNTRSSSAVSLGGNPQRRPGHGVQIVIIVLLRSPT